MVPGTFFSSPSSSTFEQKNISDFWLTYMYQRLESMTEFLRDLITTRFNDRIPSRGPTIVQYKYRHHQLFFSDPIGPSMDKKTIKNCFQNFRLSSQNKPDKSNNKWPTDSMELQWLPVRSFQALVQVLLNRKIFLILGSLPCTKNLIRWLNFNVTW